MILNLFIIDNFLLDRHMSFSLNRMVINWKYRRIVPTGRQLKKYFEHSKLQKYRHSRENGNPEYG